MPYWDHKKAIGSAGGLFAVPIYPRLRGVPLRLPELASLGSVGITWTGPSPRPDECTYF